MFSPCGVLQQFDTALFRLINQAGTTALDPFITFFNGGPDFKRGVVIAGLLVLWKGNRRARLCLLFLALTLIIGDGLICATIKSAVGRQRPYQQFSDTRMPSGRGNHGSMPSSHAANMAAIALVLAAFYPRSKWLGIPVTFMVCLARVYSGVHFPSDVVAGVLIASAYTWGILHGAERLWKSKAPSLVPGVFEKIPSLLNPTEAPPRATTVERPISWVKLGWYVIGLTLVLRVLYLYSGKIELSEDEAYQWLWSKHLALSYYSKPPLIAYTQFLGTSIWGDSEFGIRFFAPILGAITASFALLLVAREANPRAGFITTAAGCASLMLAAGAILMTVDSLSVLFWTAALFYAWRAIKLDSTRDWAFTGIAVALGLLAKYVALLEWICILLFLAVHAPARRQFTRPGLYLGILISLLGLLPVIVWNQQNGWITLTHLEERSGLNNAWTLTYKFAFDFVLAEFALLNPVFIILTVWAALRFWKNRSPLQTFLFCMGAPLFIGYLAYTLRARVQPNWIAPSILPLFALAATYWEPRWENVRRYLKPWLITGFMLGLGSVIFLHDTNLISKVLGFSLPAHLDPLNRARGGSALGALFDAERKKLADQNPFIIADHYGIASLMTFYIPEARQNPAQNNLVYAMATKTPRNQFYFWPNYLKRSGENAIFVARAKADLPEDLKGQFESFDYLGPREISYRGRVINTVYLYLCHNLHAETQAASGRRL